MNTRKRRQTIMRKLHEENKRLKSGLASLWFGADGRPVKIDDIPAPRLVNVLRFAYRNFLDRENPARWENLMAACQKTLKKDVDAVLRNWDRDEREKLRELMEAQEQRRVENLFAKEASVRAEEGALPDLRQRRRAVSRSRPG